MRADSGVTTKVTDLVNIESTKIVEVANRTEGMESAEAANRTESAEAAESAGNLPADLRRICAEIERLLERAARMGERGPVNVAIDGMCGGGKSTLGAWLSERYGGNLFHMDDFFLRPEQRTPERYAQAGGNVDYERFQEEVLAHLPDEGGLDCRRFDCRSMSLEESRHIPWRKLNIVEGAYSCHPYFGDAYQLRFFVEVSAEEQRRRILKRNGRELFRKFEQDWIPMENRYFEVYGIREKCICVSGEGNYFPSIM